MFSFLFFRSLLFPLERRGGLRLKLKRCVRHREKGETDNVNKQLCPQGSRSYFGIASVSLS